MHVSVTSFEGPLDTLLDLIVAQKLEISAISLTKVADQYFSIVQSKTHEPAVLAPYLVVAAQLLFMKTRALLPQPQQEEIDEAAEDMTARLKRLEAARRGATHLQHVFASSRFLRPMQFSKPAASFSPSGMSVQTLHNHAQRTLVRYAKEQIALKKERLTARITVEARLEQLSTFFCTRTKASFASLLAGERSKDHAIVTFLSILELAKRGRVRVSSGKNLHETIITRVAAS